MPRASLIAFALLTVLAVEACKAGQSASKATTAAKAEGAPAPVLGCDHDLESNAIAEHSWPYPADAKDLRWIARYTTVKLKLRPRQASFDTATLIFRRGDRVEIEDSQVHIIKPRRLVAKRDLYVMRKAWDQGVEVQRPFLAAAEGQPGSFLFYNSRGMCLVGTEQGPGWTPCTLDDAFEGLSAEHPFACEQVWWVKIRRSKVDQGWLPFDPALMERVPATTDAAK